MAVNIFQVGRDLLDLLGQGNSSRTGELLNSIRFQFPEEFPGILLVTGLFHHDIFRFDGQNPGIVLPDQLLHLVAIGESFGGHLVEGNLLVDNLIQGVVEGLQDANLLFNLLGHCDGHVLGGIDDNGESINSPYLRFGSIQTLNIDFTPGEDHSDPVQEPHFVLTEN